MAGQSYTVDFWAATAGSGSFRAAVVGLTGFNHVFNSATGYTEFTFNFTATGISSQLLFHAAGTLFFDDISVEPTGVGVPDGGTTVSLLGCALFGLAGLRRKLGC